MLLLNVEIMAITTLVADSSCKKFPHNYVMNASVVLFIISIEP